MWQSMREANSTDSGQSDGTAKKQTKIFSEQKALVKATWEVSEVYEQFCQQTTHFIKERPGKPPEKQPGKLPFFR